MDTSGGDRFHLNTSKARTLNSSDRFHELPQDRDKSSEQCKWSPGGFYFVQAADTQFGMIDNYVKKLPDVRWDEEIALSKKLIQRCNAMSPKPKFMVICGDLVDALPGTAMRRDQVNDFKRIFSDLDPEIPLVCVCGNHDVGNEPTQAGLEEYWRDFNEDYFYFVTGGVLFIVINSQFYQHRAHLEDYARRQDEWLEGLLENKCKQYKYSIVFEHIPWFLKDPNEDDDYMNIGKELRLKWLKKFSAAGVSKIMCGHYHGNAGGWYNEKLEIVVTSAVGAQLREDQSGARIVKLLDDHIEHQYYNLDEIPTQVTL